jgi:hypothetical protein
MEHLQPAFQANYNILFSNHMSYSNTCTNYT